MQTGPAIVEISKEIFKKIENRTTTAQLYYSWAYTQGTLSPATELWILVYSDSLLLYSQ